MSYGTFVDIIQQDGTPVRMFYPMEDSGYVKWIGLQEQMSEKFNEGKRKQLDSKDEAS